MPKDAIAIVKAIKTAVNVIRIVAVYFPLFIIHVLLYLLRAKEYHETEHIEMTKLGEKYITR